ncbi:hypothetical protein D3C72_2490610 [compost metagenome]
MGLRVHVRVHPERNGRAHAHALRDFRQPAQLGFGFHVETFNLGRERIAHFPGLLAHA